VPRRVPRPAARAAAVGLSLRGSAWGIAREEITWRV
jgi:hypothetical protein